MRALRADRAAKAADLRIRSAAFAAEAARFAAEAERLAAEAAALAASDALEDGDEVVVSRTRVLGRVVGHAAAGLCVVDFGGSVGCRTVATSEIERFDGADPVFAVPVRFLSGRHEFASGTLRVAAPDEATAIVLGRLAAEDDPNHDPRVPSLAVAIDAQPEPGPPCRPC